MHCNTPSVYHIFIFKKSNITSPQWLTTHRPSTEHDLSHGLRDHFNPRSRWRFAINSARAINRFHSFSNSGSRKSTDIALAAWDDDDSSEEGLGLKQKEVKKESEEEDDRFVKVVAPGESEDSEDKVTTNDETESDSEKRLPPPYSDDAGSSRSRGKEKKCDSDYTKAAKFTGDAPIQSEPESDVPATNDETDFHVRMPGSFGDSGPRTPGQGSPHAHNTQHPPYPRLGGGGGWADLMKRLGIR